MNLDRLPYDLLFGISLFLDIEDVVHLGNTSPHLRILLEEETLCRRLLEVRLCQLETPTLPNIDSCGSSILHDTLWRPSLHRREPSLTARPFAGYTSEGRHLHQEPQFQPR